MWVSLRLLVGYSGGCHGFEVRECVCARTEIRVCEERFERGEKLTNRETMCMDLVGIRD